MESSEENPGDQSSSNGKKLEGLIKDGFDLIKKNDGKNAKKYFLEAFTIDAKDKRVLCGSGWVQALQGNHLTAIEIFKNLSKHLANEDKCYLCALRGQAYCLMNRKEYSKAIDLYDQHFKIDPNTPSIYFNRGYSLIQLDRYEEAYKCFQRYLEFQTEESKDLEYLMEAYNYKGLTEVNLDKLELAEKSFDFVLTKDPTSFGAKVGKTLVQQKRYYVQQQQELIVTAKKYLKCLLKDFRKGLNIAQYMYIIQFSAGIGLLVYALVLAGFENDSIIVYIAGASGGLIAILSLIFSAPGDLQKNRVDFSQWMIAYFNWINTLYAVSGAINQQSDQRSKNKKEAKWEEIQPLQDYLSKVTIDTITYIEQFCEPKKLKKFSIPSLNLAATNTKDKANTATIQTDFEPKDTPQVIQPNQPLEIPVDLPQKSENK
jgi:tetratricopeptide (TPR) repeat protein